MFRKIYNAMIESRTRQALRMLSDRELKDIGVNRGDIDRISKESYDR